MTEHSTIKPIQYWPHSFNFRSSTIHERVENIANEVVLILYQSESYSERANSRIISTENNNLFFIYFPTDNLLSLDWNAFFGIEKVSEGRILAASANV